MRKTDAKTRCPWRLDNAAYVAYHDHGTIDHHLVGYFRHPQLQGKQ
jgi:hypothetical protein